MREVRYGDFRLLSRSSYPLLVPCIGTRSGAFEQGIADQFEVTGRRCRHQRGIRSVAVAESRLLIQEIRDRGLHSGKKRLVTNRQSGSLFEKTQYRCCIIGPRLTNEGSCEKQAEPLPIILLTRFSK